MHPDVLTVQSAAELAAVDVTTLRRSLAHGQMPGARLGRNWRLWRPALLEAVGAAQPPPSTVTVPEVVTLADLGVLLGISKPTLISLAAGGHLPARKVGALWRVHWPSIVAMMATPHSELPSPPPAPPAPPAY